MRQELAVFVLHSEITPLCIFIQGHANIGFL